MSLELRANVYYPEVLDTEMLKLVIDERLLFNRDAVWITRGDLADAPGEVIGRTRQTEAFRDECLIRLDGAVARLILTERALRVQVGAPDDATCEAALDRIRAAIPEVGNGDEEVPVRFWWWRSHDSSDTARMLPADQWEEVESNYAGGTAAALARHVAWRNAPPAGGRLLLWHGAPGTGKTTAVRALAREWRDWASFEFITDPERFLQIPNYLLGAISSKGSGDRDPWKVIVLEDSGEFLAPDAKTVNGQALSRLLNVCDGALGQATRALILATTNEALHRLHPALTRPGRCLADVEFKPLDRAEAASWCQARGLPALDRDQCTLAELFAHADGRLHEPAQTPVGFAAAA